MNSAFSFLDWFVFVTYFLILAFTSFILSRKKVTTTNDYFLASNSVPMFAAAVSVLATSQSAATFLGGPEYSYGKDLTFLGFYFSSFLGVIFVAKILIPRFYEIHAVTVYELLEKRYGPSAKKQAGVMFLIGRVFASGARLYIGALAISMILFLDISAWHVFISVLILMFGAIVYVYFGGVRSVIYSDVIQAFTYTTAALFVLWYLYSSLNISFEEMLVVLNENSKLKIIDLSMSGGFSLWALLSGWFLLNIAAYGLDQDITQRALSLKNSKEAQKSLMFSIYMTIPVALIFLIIGLLLYLFYSHPELSSFNGSVVQSFEGEKITIFMYYILHEMPEGLRGLVTVGAVAAALSSSNSVLGAMSSVAIEDLYKPYRQSKNDVRSEKHYLKASRVAVVIFATLLSSMAMLSYYWQQYTQLELLSFALGVMAFAYAGLLGVYGAAIFTKRGSSKTVLVALIAGFITVLALQPYTFGISLGFSWQIIIGTLVSFSIMLTSSQEQQIHEK